MEDANIKKLENEHQEQGAMTMQKNRKVNGVMVACVVAALGFAGFGGFMTVLNLKADRHARDLDAELARKNETIRQVEEKLGAKVEVETEPKAEDAAKNEPVAEVKVSAARDYIYVGEWGVKIKVPENLNPVSYAMHPTVSFGEIGMAGVLYISGVKTPAQFVPSFVENTVSAGTGMGALTRFRKSQVANAETVKVGDMAMPARSNGDARGLGAVSYVDDDYIYTYSMGNGIYVDENADSSEYEWYGASGALVGEMLRNNVSAF